MEHERRRSIDPAISQLKAEVANLAGVIAERRLVIDETVDGMRADINHIKASLAKIEEVWQAIEGGLKVLGWLGSVIKAIAVLGGAITAVSAAWWAMTHWGHPPKG